MNRSMGLGFLLGVSLFGLVLIYTKSNNPPATVAIPAPELAREKPQLLECKPVLVYRDKVATKLGVKTQPGEHVVTATKLPADTRPHTVSAVYNEYTGGVQLFDRRDPAPWLGFARGGELGVTYLSKSGRRDLVWQLDGRLELMQVKALHGGLVGNWDGGGDRSVGVRIWGAWK